MKPTMKKLVLHSFYVLALGMMLPAGSALAQSFPSKPIRLVVPFAPGGNVDITARTIAGPLGEALGQPVIIDNRAGASGSIGTDNIAKSPADGYSLLLASTSVMTNVPAINPKLPYDMLRDLTGVGRVSIVPLVIVVNPATPAKTLREFIDLSNTKTGGLTIGTPGSGTTNHLIGELLHSTTRAKFVMVHYKGSGPALTDAMAGVIDAQIDQVTSAISFIRAGKVRAIAVTTATRAAMLPDVPTLAESGAPGFDASTVTAILAPAATPRAVITQLNLALSKILSTAPVRDRFATLGADASPSTPEQLNAHIREDLARWKKVVQESNIKPE